jgi:hypothetical protein
MVMRLESGDETSSGHDTSNAEGCFVGGTGVSWGDWAGAGRVGRRWRSVHASSSWCGSVRGDVVGWVVWDWWHDRVNGGLHGRGWNGRAMAIVSVTGSGRGKANLLPVHVLLYHVEHSVTTDVCTGIVRVHGQLVMARRAGD